MIEVLQFWFSGFWIWLGGLIVASMILKAILIAWTAVFRCVSVSLRGWPPEHLDADGDFHTADKENDKQSCTSQQTKS